MTALLTPPLIDTTPVPDVTTARAAWSTLVASAAALEDSAASRAALGEVVARLERRAGRSLGSIGGDALVVLQRRLGRVHGLLLSQGLAPDVDERLFQMRTGPEEGKSGCDTSLHV